MSDDSKNAGKVAQQDEPSDEVEAHGKLDSRVDRPNVADEGNDDEVEGHIKVAAPKND
jgi:hypothetical protein